jgi:hypothetical protein
VKLKVAADLIVLPLVAALCLAWAGAAQAGGMGFGGGSMGGGFHGGGFHGGGFHGGGHRGFHGGHFKNPAGFRARVICNNGTCVTTVAFNAGFPAYGGGGPNLFPEYWSPSETSSATPEPQTQAEVAALAFPREACSSTGCYHLEGDGKEVPFRWAWVPNPPPPPPAPVTLEYWNGRYVQQAPSHWVWIPNAAASPAPTVPSEPTSAPVPSQFGRLYRWVDKHGVVHWTQGLENVPEQYRPQQGRGSAG